MVPVSSLAAAQAVATVCGYTLGQAVGSGVFKDTYEATEGQTRYAIKVFKPGGDVERIRREVNAMLVCDHPAIAKLRRVDVVIVDGQECLYAIEDFLAGGTLGHRLRARGHSLTVSEALAVGTTLIDALDHIAGRRLVHRDIKLENIMLRGDDLDPVVVDFGLVRTLGETSLTKSWAGRGPGTPLFASPEQLCNDKHLIDWRSDQFALGVSLSMARYGTHPFRENDRESDHEIIDRLSQRQCDVPRAFVDQVTQDGLPTLARMVAVWPVDRVCSSHELIAEWQAQGEREA